MKMYCISDQHFGTLGATETEKVSAWHRFVDFLIGEANVSLYILGDFFDYWVEYKKVIRKEYLSVLDGFRRLQRAGIPVTYIEGNHDFMGCGFLRDEYGVEVITGAHIIHHSGKKILMQHGDSLKKSPTVFFEKNIMRNPVIQSLYKLLPVDFATTFALKVSAYSKARNCRKSFDERMKKYMQGIITAAEKEGCCLHILGHLHIPEVRAVSPEVIYANCGSWNREYPVVVIQSDCVELSSVDALIEGTSESATLSFS